MEPIIDMRQALSPIVQALDTAETIIVAGTPVDWTKEIDCIVIANVTGSAATFSLYLHEAGVAAATGNAICVDVAINANTIYQLPVGPFLLPDGWVFSGLTSSGDAVNVTVTGRFVPRVPDQYNSGV